MFALPMLNANVMGRLVMALNGPPQLAQYPKHVCRVIQTERCQRPSFTAKLLDIWIAIQVEPAKRLVSCQKVIV